MKATVRNMKRVSNENLAWLSDNYEVHGPSKPAVTGTIGPIEACKKQFDLLPIVDWLANGRKGKKMTTTIETNERNNKALRAGTLAKCTELCRTAARKLKQLEEQLIKKLTADIQESVPRQLVQQAMNEAEALAWSTPYPLLFLPELAQEKIQSAQQWNRRQQQIFRS
jgi:hypothetical protein